MTAEPSPALVDTNVLVYAFTRDDSRRHEIARELLKRLTQSGDLRLSTQVMQEFYVTVTGARSKRPMTADEAIIRMDQLSPWLKYTTDYSGIREAVLLSKEAIVSFWDALIVVAAARCGATILYTEDLNHGQKILGVTVVNPFL